ncbi:MAG: elongation factor 1-beta [Euryarchaeota archaeon]|nr:elongation factor 1-beta [Euryarchaeota archaeon]
MAEVLVTAKIMPKTAEVNVDDILEKVRDVSGARFNSAEKEPIAFGLVAIVAKYVVADEEGAAEKLEQALRGIPEVGEVEITEVHRLL